MIVAPSRSSSTRSKRPRTRVCDAEREVLLDGGRLGARALLLVPEARHRLAARGSARLLVLPRQKALVQPLRVVLGEQVRQRGVVALDAAFEIELDDLVDRRAVHDRVVPE